MDEKERARRAAASAVKGQAVGCRPQRPVTMERLEKLVQQLEGQL